VTGPQPANHATPGSVGSAEIDRLRDLAVQHRQAIYAYLSEIENAALDQQWKIAGNRSYVAMLMHEIHGLHALAVGDDQAYPLHEEYRRALTESAGVRRVLPAAAFQALQERADRHAQLDGLPTIAQIENWMGDIIGCLRQLDDWLFAEYQAQLEDAGEQ